ncbi:MAG: cold shock domain-containing protein [Candidatus Cloacimonetes bacterium]|nr:cold shock domain-containing protein [Candidatus Cloacimonadota bacterium]
MKGRVKWFNTTKGYGFIISEEGSEFFVHWRSIVTTSDNNLKTLEDDEDVQFDTIDTDKGVQAINVVRLNV